MFIRVYPQLSVVTIFMHPIALKMDISSAYIMQDLYKFCFSE